MFTLPSEMSSVKYDEMSFEWKNTVQFFLSKWKCNMMDPIITQWGLRGPKVSVVQQMYSVFFITVFLECY